MPVLWSQIFMYSTTIIDLNSIIQLAHSADLSGFLRAAQEFSEHYICVKLTDSCYNCFCIGHGNSHVTYAFVTCYHFVSEPALKVRCLAEIIAGSRKLPTCVWPSLQKNIQTKPLICYSGFGEIRVYRLIELVSTKKRIQKQNPSPIPLWFHQTWKCFHLLATGIIQYWTG